MQTIPHWLNRQAMIKPNKVAIENEDSQWTFQQLHRQSELFAKKLVQAGVKESTSVGIYSSNHINMILAIHALSYIGAVAVLLNTKLTKRELTYQVTDSDVQLILTSDDLYGNLQKMQLNTPIYDYDHIHKLDEKKVVLKQYITLKAPFTIMYTSGTTGMPKGVIHTYENYLWSSFGSLLNLGLSEHDKWLAILPMFHIGGLSIFIRSVIYGMSVQMFEKFDASRVNHAIQNEGITIISIVTVMLKRLVDELGLDKYPSTMRCMLLGGGAAPAQLLKQAAERNMPVFQSYGMTETCSQIVTLAPSDIKSRMGSSGKPLYPAEVDIFEPGMDGVGEIFVKGPMITKGYYKNDEANKELFHDGWLSTGDLGRIDEKGFLYVVDRRNDLIISGGENIYPTEVEHVLSEMSGVSEAGVIGIEHAEWGEVPVAFIVKSNNDLTEAIILKHVEDNLASYKRPQQVYFVNELPRNASNKLLRRELSAWIKESPFH